MSFKDFQFFISDDETEWAIECKDAYRHKDELLPYGTRGPLSLMLVSDEGSRHWQVFMSSIAWNGKIAMTFKISGTFGSVGDAAHAKWLANQLARTEFGDKLKGDCCGECSTAHIPTSVKVEFAFVGGPFHGTKEFVDPQIQVCDMVVQEAYHPCLEDREIEGLTGKQTRIYPPSETFRYIRKTFKYRDHLCDVFAYSQMSIGRFIRLGSELADQGKL